MHTLDRREQAARLRALHAGPALLVLPNAWDRLSARLFEDAGFAAIATTSSGVAAALGAPDGQQISREQFLAATRAIVGAVRCPVTVDMEAGYGASIDDILQTVRALIDLGAVGINIEDSSVAGTKTLVEIAYQTDLLGAIRRLADEMGLPLVINARVDAFLRAAGNHAAVFDEAVARARAYRQAGADCIYPITLSDAGLIERFAQAVPAPINILAGPQTPTLPELARLGVRRVTFASSLLRAALGQLRLVAQELQSQGTYSHMAPLLSSADLKRLVEQPSAE
jgi:2-methylisocitrate lyase-like PEP mutase family enzyme